MRGRHGVCDDLVGIADLEVSSGLYHKNVKTYYFGFVCLLFPGLVPSRRLNSKVLRTILNWRKMVKYDNYCGKVL